MELFLHSSPVASWTSSDLGSSSSGVISFCLFILFMGFLRQEYWSGSSFPPPVDMLELSIMTCPSWETLHSMAHRFIELRRPLCHYKVVIQPVVMSAAFSSLALLLKSLVLYICDILNFWWFRKQETVRKLDLWVSLGYYRTFGPS